MINTENQKTEKAKRWIHACGRKDFTNVDQISKSTYICSLHFSKDNPDPIIATSVTEKERKYCEPRKRPPPPTSPSPSPPQPSPPASDMNNEVEKVGETLSFVHQGTQTQTDDDKSVLAAKLENKILRNSIITANDSQSQQRNTNCMSFQTIYSDRDTCKYFIGLLKKEI